MNEMWMDVMQKAAIVIGVIPIAAGAPTSLGMNKKDVSKKY